MGGSEEFLPMSEGDAKAMRILAYFRLKHFSRASACSCFKAGIRSLEAAESPELSITKGMVLHLYSWYLSAMI